MTSSVQPDPAGLFGARKRPMPRHFEPQLATLVSTVPKGEGWLHEVKYDGYRAFCRIENGSARFLTRRGNDWTSKFGKLPEAAVALPAESALLDGEIVILLTDGTTSFQALQEALGRGVKGKDQPIYYVFDLLYLDGYDLTQVPLIERKKALASLISDRSGLIRYSDHYEGEGQELYDQACRHGLEGVVSKRVKAPYKPGRGADWLKIKCFNRQEFVIGGFTDPEGSRKGLGSLLAGVYENGKLRYGGKVGTGFTTKTLLDLRSRLERLEQSDSPFSNPPTGAEAKNVHWVKPELVAEVNFTSWTRDGMLRHPSFQGLREDKAASEVRAEKPAAPARQQETERPAGVKLTHPDRILYPDPRITKLELAKYYEAVADWMLPHVADRPLTLVRCPEGSDSQCFFQKHASRGVPDVIRQVQIQEQKGPGTCLAIDSVSGLIALVQMGVLEIHTWGCRLDRLEQPDRMIFDLDPDPDLAWEQVVEAARRVRTQLERAGLKSFLKTTGGKGLHVVVPLVRRAGWDEVKQFSQAVAQNLVRKFPDQYVARMSKARRKGKIYIDYLRNARGATAVSPYSSRARPNAPVSTPIQWDELIKGVRPDQFTIRSVPERLARLKRDPWEEMSKVRQFLPRSLRDS